MLSYNQIPFINRDDLKEDDQMAKDKGKDKGMKKKTKKKGK